VRIVVTGREGQVVRSLAQFASNDIQIVPLGRPQLDLAGSAESIEAAIEAERPNVIVSAAAYTQVDKAESEPDLAFTINADGPRAIARSARRLGVPLIHLSTDYVFDGSKASPYVEEDATGPTGVYGSSKLAGERAVLEECENTAVLRTAWVYSSFGANFVKTMLRLARDRDEIGIVCDQVGNPSSAEDIAGGILKIARNLQASNEPARRGIFHMTGSGEASWAQFAEAIFAISAEANGPTATVQRIVGADFPTAAKRPANSRLDSTKLERNHAVRLPDWHPSLKRVVNRLLLSSK
jgi:dTDP-4-dehydrorhamnose reductase